MGKRKPKYHSKSRKTFLRKIKKRKAPEAAVNEGDDQVEVNVSENSRVSSDNNDQQEMDDRSHLENPSTVAGDSNRVRAFTGLLQQSPVVDQNDDELPFWSPQRPTATLVESLPSTSTDKDLDILEIGQLQPTLYEFQSTCTPHRTKILSTPHEKTLIPVSPGSIQLTSTPTKKSRNTRLEQVFEEDSSIQLSPISRADLSITRETEIQSFEEPTTPTKKRGFSAETSNFPDLEVEIVRAIGADKQISKLTGNRIVNISHIISAARRLENHECPVLKNPGYLSYDHEVRNGFTSDIVFKCTTCPEKRTINTSGMEKADGSNLNLAAVWGTVSIGRGYYHLQELMAMLDVPTPSFPTYKKYENDVGETWLASLSTAIEAAIKEEIELAVAAGDVNESGVPQLVVIVDGGWSHRSYGHSYTANSGVAVIIGRRTKKILFIGVRQKYCSICSVATARAMPIPEHRCFKNWDKSSPAMEADIIVEGFILSEKLHGVQYKEFIADGDSSVFKKIKERVPYGRSVQKTECSNHLVKNVTKKLHALADQNAETRTILKGKVNDMGGYSRFLICQNAREETPSVSQLKRDLLNVPKHSFGDHASCRAAVCEKAGHSDSQTYNNVPKFIQQRIAGIMNALVVHGDSLILNDTSNLAEACMHLVAKFNGYKQVFYGQRSSYITRTHGAGLSYQYGDRWHAVAWKKAVGHSPGKIMKRLIRSRIKKKTLVARNVQKKYRHFRKIRQSVGRHNPDYGTSCQKPDMPDSEITEAGDRLILLLNVTPEEQADIELKTRGQASNPRWFQERQQRLTASHFGEVCKRRTPPGPLVKKLLYSVTFRSAAIEWGKEHEAIAISEYEKELGVQVNQCGLFIDLNMGFLAASPDGLVGDNKVIEVKCPFSARNMTPARAANELKGFYCKLTSDGKLALDRRHNYFYQVQGQLLITNRHLCDFIVWTPHGINIETIKRDDQFISLMTPKLQSFYRSSMLIEIVDPRQTRSMAIRGTVLKSKEPAHKN